MKNLVTALIKARADFKALKKDAVNPFFGNRNDPGKGAYASWGSMIEATDKALCANGLTIICMVKVLDSAYSKVTKTSMTYASKEMTKGDVTTVYHDGCDAKEEEVNLPIVVLEAHLVHESGEEMVATYPLIVDDITNPQKLASAGSYAERYIRRDFLQIPAEDDDDGNSALPEQVKHSYSNRK